MPLVSAAFKANLFWLGKQPLEQGRRYLLRVATEEVECEVAAIHRIIDTMDFQVSSKRWQQGDSATGELTLCRRSPSRVRLVRLIRSDPGRFVLVDDYDIAGGSCDGDDQRRSGISPGRGAPARLRVVKGEVGIEERAQQYGHRAAIVLITGGRHTGKSFLARKLEARLVADGRHAYLLDGENLRRGLDADLAEGERSQTMEMARRYGEVARLLADTGLIVVSTTNPFGMAYAEAAQAIRTLVHPTPVISIQMSTLSDEASTNADLVFSGPADFDAATKSILDELKRRVCWLKRLGPNPPSSIPSSSSPNRPPTEQCQGGLVPGLTGSKLLCYRTTLIVLSCSEGILWP